MDEINNILNMLADDDEMDDDIELINAIQQNEYNFRARVNFDLQGENFC